MSSPIPTIEYGDGNDMIPDLKEEHNRELLSDVTDGCSNCCGAPMVQDICRACGEHCESVEEDVNDTVYHTMSLGSAN